MINKVILIGRLGSNPEMKVYEGGKKIAWMNLATNKRYVQNNQKQEKTSWHRLICYGLLADFVYETLTKGKLIYVEGRLDYWGKEKSPVIIVETLKILSPKKTLSGKEEELKKFESLEEDIPLEEIPF